MTSQDRWTTIKLRGETIHFACMTTKETTMCVIFIRPEERPSDDCPRCGQPLNAKPTRPTDIGWFGDNDTLVQRTDGSYEVHPYVAPESNRSDNEQAQEGSGTRTSDRNRGCSGDPT